MKINHTMSISKILTDLCVIKQKKRNKKYFCKCCLQCFSSKEILRKYKNNWLKINSKQTVKLKSGSIRFKNYFKQLAVPFRVYADFECLLKGVKSNDKNNSSYIKKYKTIFLAVLLIKLFALIINLASKLFFTEEKMQFIDLLK